MYSSYFAPVSPPFFKLARVWQAAQWCRPDMSKRSSTIVVVVQGDGQRAVCVPLIKTSAVAVSCVLACQWLALCEIQRCHDLYKLLTNRFCIIGCSSSAWIELIMLHFILQLPNLSFGLESTCSSRVLSTTDPTELKADQIYSPVLLVQKPNEPVIRSTSRIQTTDTQLLMTADACRPVHHTADDLQLVLLLSRSTLILQLQGSRNQTCMKRTGLSVSSSSLSSGHELRLLGNILLGWSDVLCSCSHTVISSGIMII